jgi:hypothetical protein
MEEKNLKNVKIEKYVHSQIREIYLKTGLGIAKLVEMGCLKIIEDFKNGKFDYLLSVQKQVKRNGSITH